MSRLPANLIDKKFGRLTVLSFSHIRSCSNACFNCLCDCGKEKIIVGFTLKNGSTKSCGCLQKEIISRVNTIHGMSDTSIHNIWMHMKDRCYNKKDKAYKNYGGRGIKVCKRWLNSFINFYKDMGDKPKNKSLDRINNDGDYTLKNCKWSTPKEQCNNTRKNVKVAVKGEIHTIAEWERIRKVNSGVIHERLNKLGWSPERAVFTKVRKMSNNTKVSAL